MVFSVDDVERLVAQALDELPEHLAALLDNVFVMVEEEPSDEDLESVGMSRDAGDELFGLYQGVPLTERDTYYDALPDRVVIYAGPICRTFETRREAVEEIKKTVVHELGHHFGMEEDQMPW